LKNIKTQTALSVCLILWATAFTGIRTALQYYEPAHLSFMRNLFASVVLIPVAVFMRFRIHSIQDGLLFLIAGTIGIGVYILTLTTGEQTTTAASASFIVNSSPVFTAILATVFLKEKITLTGWMGILITFTGSTLIAFGENHSLQFSKGALLILASALSTSIYIVMAKPLLKRYSSIEVTTYIIWAGTIFLFFFSKKWLHAIQINPLHSTLLIVYLALAPGIMAYFLWSYVLSVWDASRTSATLLLVPFITILMGIVLNKEMPGWIAIAGGMISVAGVIILFRFGGKNQWMHKTPTERQTQDVESFAYSFRTRKKRERSTIY